MKARNCSIFLHWISIVKKIEPRKVLPISPINILDGSQLKNKKAKREEAIGIYMWFKKMEAIKKIIKKQPATIPSIPSTKFIKLIRVIPNKTKKGTIIYTVKILKYEWIPIKYKIKTTVANCTKILNFLDKFILSSSKPIKAKGIEIIRE